MTTFLAIYRGKTISDARLVGVSINPQLVQLVAQRMTEDEGASEVNNGQDPVLASLKEGQARALKAIAAQDQVSGHQRECRS